MIRSLSIIFPVFNEKLRLKSSFNHILSFLKKKKKFKIQIIFVDDGSTDNSYNLINEFIKKYKNFKTSNRVKFKIIKSSRNLGKGSALKLGVSKSTYDWILTTDIDMSVSLFQICNWMEKKLINKKYFVYFGSRKNKESIVESNFFRQILGNIMSFLTLIILNIKIKDTQCGYKLYKKSLAKRVFRKLKDYGFNHDLEIILSLKKVRILIKELPVKWKHKNKSRLNIFFDPIKMLIGIFLMKLRFF